MQNETNQFEMSLPVPLTKEELLEHGQKAADLNLELQKQEADKKAAADSFKGVIAGLEQDRDEHLTLLRAKKESRAVQCVWEMDVPRKGMKTIRRLDTMAEVKTEQMDQKDLQRTLDEVVQ
jgi:hypothetical protein